jgi:hypothetical protein
VSVPAEAVAARSILSCPVEIDLAVDGVARPLADEARLGLQDCGGTPVFLCERDGALATAAAASLAAVLTVVGVDESSLAVAGRLRHSGTDVCSCCGECRDVVALVADRVVLVSGSQRIDVEVGDFADPALRLNPGFLARTAEHVNRHHQDELRHALAERTGQRVGRIAGAQLTDLTAREVEIQWVALDGGHSTLLTFPSVAVDPDGLGEMLRRTLHPGIC